MMRSSYAVSQAALTRPDTTSRDKDAADEYHQSYGESVEA